MEYQFHEQLPSNKKNIYLNDCVINEIKLYDSSIELLFHDGVIICDEFDIQKMTSNAVVTINNVVADDVDCKRFRRFASPYGAFMLGKPIDISTLYHKMKKKDMSIEVIDVLYGYQQLFIKGAVLPYRKRGLSDRIVFEVKGDFQLECSWNDY